VGDNHEGAVTDVAKKLVALRAREAQLWGRKVATAEVTPGMLAHHEGSGVRCVCDTCDGTRPQPTLPAALLRRSAVLVNRRKKSASVADQAEPLQERGPERRRLVRANPPMRAPELNARQLAFLDRLRK